MTEVNRSGSDASVEPGSVRKRVAIVYQVLHHFREPVFRALSSDSRIEYTFFAAAKNTLDTNATIDPAKAELPVEEGGLRWRFVDNVELPGGLLWQRGVVGVAANREFDAIVFLGNPYYVSTWLGAALARLSGKQTLMWGHGLVRPETGLKWSLRRAFYRIAHGHLLYSERAKRMLVDRGFAPDRLHVVYNSLDYATQSRIRESITPGELEATRARLFSDEKLPVVCCIGRIDRRKHIDHLIAAAAELNEAARPVNVLIIGDGEHRAELAAQARDLGIEHLLCFYGACYDEEEVGRLLSMSALCVCPGHTGLTAVHAMAYGVPVITHDDLDGHAPEVEIIVPGENGELYDAGDPGSLSRAIAGWLDAGRDAEVVRRSCLAAIEDRYTPEDQARAIARVLLDDDGIGIR